MNKTDPAQKGSSQDPDAPSAQGPNLILLYGLLAVALVLAIIVAAFIVLPFYHRH